MSDNPIRDVARQLNPTGGALGDALPFSLTPQVARGAQHAQLGLALEVQREAAPSFLPCGCSVGACDCEPDLVRCWGCGVQAEIESGKNPFWCVDCRDAGHPTDEEYRNALEDLAGIEQEDDPPDSHRDDGPLKRC